MALPADVRDLGNGWIEVPRRFRLWSAVPVEERLSEDDVKRRNARLADWVTDRDIELLRNPGCVVAIQFQGRALWRPCGNPASGPLCAAHSPNEPGSKAARKSYRQLKAENEAMAARLRNLERIASEQVDA